jgi:hypothetical protein
LTFVCKRCGYTSEAPSICSNCNIPLTLSQPKGEQKQSESASAAWYLLPLFFGIIGGVIAWAVNKDRDPKRARNMVIFGAIWTFVGVFLWGLFIGSLVFGLIGTSGSNNLVSSPSTVTVTGYYNTGDPRVIYTSIIFQSDNGQSYSIRADSSSGQYSVSLPVNHFYTITAQWQPSPSYLQALGCPPYGTNPCYVNSGSVPCGSVDVGTSDLTYNLSCTQ